MNKKLKIFTIVVLFALGLSACAGATSELTDLSTGSTSENQAPDTTEQQPPEEQSPPQGNPPQGKGQKAQKGERKSIDFASAAAQLGVSEEALQAAMEEFGQRSPDFAAIAEQLGVSEQDLIAAIGIPRGGPPQDGNK